MFAPPQVAAVDPDVIDQSALLITVTGSDFSGVPVIRLINEGFTYNCVGESFLDENTATAWVIQSQALPGLYDLEYTDVDGQVDILPDAVTIE
ncbi:MAG: hypothetical protein JRH10_04065 [Deltaproteobacteria bacterium]|nr:hypothetical protein [Deltaproteobacteria bacterium]